MIPEEWIDQIMVDSTAKDHQPGYLSLSGSRFIRPGGSLGNSPFNFLENLCRKNTNVVRRLKNQGQLPCTARLIIRKPVEAARSTHNLRHTNDNIFND